MATVLTEPTAPLDVLVVDDEPLIRWVLKRGLSARGHHVSEASDGQEALSALTSRQGDFDLVLLDFILPDRRDLSLLADVRRRAPASRVVMMTACADCGMREAARSAGALEVVDKPFQVDRFVRLVELVARDQDARTPEAPRV